MPQSLAKILIHTVFSTRDRHPYLHDKTLRTELHQYICGIIANRQCEPLICGGTEDHIHILSTLARTQSPAELVKEIKRSSSLWLKTKNPELHNFAWQAGYGIFSISQSHIEATRDYILTQEQHHQKISFQDEFRQLLTRYQIKYDEQFIWD